MATQAAAKKPETPAPAAPSEASKDPKRKVPVLGVPRLQRSEYARTHWLVNAEPKTTLEDIKDPQYWAHTALMIQPHDRIEVWADDNTWFAELVVIMCDRTWANVHVIGYHEVVKSQVKIEPNNDFDIRYNGQHRWHIVRKKDGHILRDGLPSQDEAAILLNQHMRSMEI